MSKQTAVELLFSELNYRITRKDREDKRLTINISEEHYSKIFEVAKQIEKQQINETYWKALGTEASDRAKSEYWLFKIASWHMIILLGVVIVAFWVWLFYSIWSML